MDFGVAGPILSLVLSVIGASIGSAMAGMTSHGVMSRVDEGHGKLIGISAMPASQLIYGFVLMLVLRNGLSNGSVSSIDSLMIGGGAGLAIMVAGIYQGLCCCSAIQATVKKPSLFGKTFVAIGIVESFALFAFVFAMLLL